MNEFVSFIFSGKKDSNLELRKSGIEKNNPD